MSQGRIVIKGIRQGLLVRFGDARWEAALDELIERVEATPAFFRDSRVALDVGPSELGRSELERARALLAERRVELWAVLSTSSVTQLVAHDMGLVVDLELPPRRTSARERAAIEPAADGLVVRRTVRSGQVLRHASDVVIIGDVNPGAEVIAGGDIVVWGRVRGILHAGAMGDEGAVVCALDLGASQVRIAGHIARAPEARPAKPVPEIASVRDGQIVVVPWRGSDLERATT